MAAACLSRAQQRALTPLLHKEMLRPLWGGAVSTRAPGLLNTPSTPERLADPAALKTQERPSPMPLALAEKGQTTP